MNIFVNFYTQFLYTLQNLRRSQALQILGFLLFWILIGAISYSLIEGWNLLEALYATVITITTVGYGDFSPQSTGGQIFAIFYTLIAISIGGYAISAFAVYTIESSQRKHARKFRKRLMKKISDFDQHYILCGANLTSTRIAEEFSMRDVEFIIISDNEEELKQTILLSHPEYFQQKIQSITDFVDVDLSQYEELSLQEISEMVNIPYIFQHPTDDAALVKAGIERAKGVIATEHDDRDNLSIVIGARNLANRSGNTKLRILSNVNQPQNMRKIMLAGADGIRNPNMTSGQELATHIMNPEVGEWWYSRTKVINGAQGLFEQMTLTNAHDWHGMTVADVHRLHRAMIVSIKRGESYLSPPAHDLTLQTGDVLIVIYPEEA